MRMDQEHGEYLIGMYLDNLPAIAAGRELSAFPKKLGSAKLFVDSDTLVGTLDYGTLESCHAPPWATSTSRLILRKPSRKWAFRRSC